MKNIGSYEVAVREIRSKDKREALHYWKNLLQGFDTRSEIPSFGNIPEAERCKVSELAIDVDEDITAKLIQLCRTEQTTTNIGAQLAWGMVLHTFSRSEDVVFAKVVSGRDNTVENVSRTIGLFINTVPVRMTFSEKTTARDMLHILQEQSIESSKYDFCSLSEIQSQSELGGNLFQTVFSFQNYSQGQKQKKRSFKVKSAVVKEEHFDDLTPVVFLNGDKLRLNLHFDNSKYREEEINCILELFKNFVHEIAERPDTELVRLNRVNETQRADVIQMSTGHVLDYDTGKTWLDLFLKNVHERPEHLAVTDEAGALTYRELDKLSDSVANFLLEKGVKADEFVVIKMQRLKEFAAAVIGIHKIGACYVPIDPDYPEERIDFMEKDCEAKIILTSEQVRQCAEKFPEPSPIHLTRPENFAYMIYTSGSTGKPKGAIIPHSALMNYTEIYIRRFGVTEADRLSHHITFSFDSHIRDFYPALAGGASLHFMSDRIVKDPALIVDFLNKNAITGAAFATAIGQLLLTSYDLKLRFISVGGEALRGVKVNGIHAFNVCGATEVTDVVVDYELEQGRFYDDVPIGRPLENCCAFILDKWGNLLPRGIPGEICYVGRNLGAGYWKRDELTKAAFTDCPILPGQVMYHTRDLGRYNHEGCVEYMGRLDFQVKLRGFRIELGEVESSAIKFKGVKQAAASVVNDHLCLYYTAESDVKVQQDDLKNFLASTLASYMVPDVFVQLEALPLTPSGKIDRKSLPEIETIHEKIIPPENEIERELYDIIRGQLHFDDFGVTSNLISQGLTSLGIMRLSAIIQTKFKTSISVSELMNEPFIRNIARKIQGTEKSVEVEDEIHSYPKQDIYPATENQKGIYLEWELNRRTTQYNIPMVFCLKEVDAVKLAGAVEKTLAVHKCMNSTFEIRGGDVVQIPHEFDITVPVIELSEEPDKEFFQKLVKPFDLNKDVLYRFEIFKFSKKTWLFMDVHHIIFDGLSQSVFMKDVMSFYEGREVDPEEFTAYDRAMFEKERDWGVEREYFLRLLSEASVMSYPSSSKPDGINGCVNVKISRDDVDGAVQKFGVTAGSFIHAAFAQTMTRLLRDEKPMYLTITSGRERKFAQSVGMFVKTVPVVCVSGGESVRDYVREMSAQLQETYQRGNYPYTRLVEEIGLRGEVALIYQGGMFEGGEVEGAEAVELELDTLKFPLTLTAFPFEDSYHIRFDYDGKRYSAKDIEILAKSLNNVILSMAHEELLSNVSLNTPESEREIVALSKGEVLEFDTERTWLDYFSEINSDNVAVVDEDRTLTYKQLEQESNSLAAYLIERGVKANDFVALCMDRCVEFVVAVVAIHKAGAAYVPIDMNYPEQRRNFMLEDSEAKVILTREIVLEAVKTPAKAVNFAVPDGYAYMIYTSGSTGQPKGTILHHRGLLNFTMSTIAQNKLTSSDRIGHHFSFSFDSHIEDLYPPLVVGASIHIMPEEIRRDTDLIYNFLVEHNITGGGFTTAIGRLLVMNYELPQRYVALMGEALTEITPKDTTIINKYGPTECTNIVASYVLEKGRHYTEVPIGRSMPNGAILLLDAKGSLVPWGCVGELCYSGPQVGYGYWKISQSFDSSLYHTGDLARYDDDGQLIYLGRIDNQVKVNGFRVEFGEIESAALRFNGVRQAAANVKHDRLILYYTEKFEVDEEALKKFLAGILADYMIPSVFVKLEKFPTTPSGKIDRKSLPEPSLNRSAKYSPPVTKSEKIIVQSLGKILGIAGDIGINDSFFELGGDSIKAIRLVSSLRESGVIVSVADVMKGKTPAEIARRSREKFHRLPQEPIEGFIGTSPIIAYFNKLNMPVPNHFNQCVCLECSEPIPGLLQKSLNAVVRQHDMLRAVLRNGRLFVRNAAEKIQIETYSADLRELTEICSSLQASINMNESLMKAALFHVEPENRWYFVLIAHHLIIDAVSWRIIISDLEVAYAQCLAGSEPLLPEKTSTYRDYVDDMNHYRGSYVLSKEIPYWENVQKKLPPFKTSRPELQSTGKIIDFELQRPDLEDVLLTAIARSYARLWHTDNVSFQLEGHGREDFGANLVIDRTVGWFTSIYPVFVENLTGDLTADFIRVKEAHQRVPHKGTGYNVLNYTSSPQISFNYFGELGGEQGFFKMAGDVDTGLTIARENSFGTDLNFNLAVMNGSLRIALTFNPDICNSELADRLIDTFITELEAVCSIEDVKTASDFGEFEWSEEEFDTVRKDFERIGQELERIYPLTPLQETMLAKHISEPGSLAYRLCYVFEVEEPLTRENVERAVALLEEKHEVLRTAFIYENVSVPRQAIVKRKPHVEFRELQDPIKLRLELLESFGDLQREANFRVVVAGKFLYVLVHHLLTDGWSSSIFLTDLFKLLFGENVDSQSRKGLYEQFVRGNLEKDKTAALQYWNGLLDDYDGSSEIPSFGNKNPLPTDEDTLSISIDSSTTQSLSELFRGATMSNVVELLWGLVLQTFNRSNDAVFAKIVSGRDFAEGVGLFINSVPVRVKINETTTARQALALLRQQSDSSAQWDFCPISDIQKSRLIKSVLAFENYDSGVARINYKIGVRPFMIKEEVFGRLDPLSFVDSEGRLTLKIAFDRSLFSRHQIETVLKLFETFAEGIANAPDLPLSALARVKPGSALEVSKGLEGSWLDLFRKSVQEFGNSVAVVDNAGSLTYNELNAQSDIVAKYIVQNKAKLVAVKMPRIKDYLSAIIGINKAGAAFIPIDPGLPGERVDFMLKDSACDLVIDELPEFTASDDSELPEVRASDIAYVIYTSGSTGQPKGVIQSHRSLLSFVSWKIHQLNLNHNSRNGQYISFSFDASLEDLICPLCVGGKVFVMDNETRNDIDAMNSYVRKNNLTTMSLPAQIGMAFINAHPDVPLESLVLGGERLVPVKKTNVKLFNEYGPTEFTICSSFKEVDQSSEEISIGRPVPGTVSLILDENLNVLPAGIVGELALAGPQIAEGYLNRSKLTGEKFVELGNFGKVYLTGDLARYDEAGELIFMGRLDRQLKIRGFRVEPSEIEGRAQKFPGIISAVVNADLILYYTSNSEINEIELAGFLAESLPDYMIPSSYVHVEEIPLLPNGKVDYASLPEVKISRENFVEPSGEIEIKIARSVGEVLRLEDRVSSTENFFTLGGDSILAIRLVNLLRGEGIFLKASDVMKAKTVKNMAGLVKTQIIAGNQEPYSGKIRNTAIVEFFRSLKLPVPGHFNQSVLLKFSGEKEFLFRAWDKLVEHHDMLRAIWIDEGLYVRDVGCKIPIEEYEIERGKFTDVCDSIQSGIVMDKALVRAALIRVNGEELFFIVAHHLVIDSVSWSILIADLESAYAGSSLPAKTAAYRDYAEAQSKYSSDSEFEYWQKVEAKLPPAPIGERKFAHITGTCTAKPTVEALITAVARSFAKMTGEKRVSLQIEGHGRQNDALGVDVDRTVGWFTAAYPVVFEGAYEIDLAKVEEVLRNVPNRGAGYMLLSQKNLVPHIGFNYLGEVGTKSTGHFEIAEGYDTGRSSDERNTFGPDLALNIVRVGEKLHISASYSVQRYEASAVRNFLKDVEIELERVGVGYPLLPLQEAMLAFHTQNPKAWGYRLVSVYELSCLPTNSQMRGALSRLAQRHEVLRTAIIYKNVAVPRQVITDRPLGFTEIDLSNESDKLSAIMKVREEILTDGFDLQDKPLFQVVIAKTSEASCYLVVAVHHIIVDGWCIKDYMTDLLGLIQEAVTGKKLLPPSKDIPGSYEKAVREILAKPRNQAINYWNALLADYNTRAIIPSYGEINEPSDTSELRIVLSKSQTDSLKNLGVTLSVISEMIWGLVLQIYNHSRDVAFTKIVSGRNLDSCDTENTVGLFINSIPVRLKSEKNTTVRELLSSMERQANESAEFDFCSPDEVQCTIFSFENFDSGVLPNDVEDEMRVREVYSREENYTDIHPFAFQNSDGELVFAISFNVMKYRKIEIQRILGLIQVLAEAIISDPDGLVDKLPKLSDDDKMKMIELCRGPVLEFDTSETWLDRFARLVETQPEHLAVTDDVSSLTYAELDRQSNAVANRLLKMGVKPNEFVIVKLHRVKEFAVAVIGIHKAGACYVPVDPDYPENRIAYMEKDSEARIILTEELVKEFALGSSEPVNLAKPGGLAYMIYTSGSTGQPKGAMIPHSALMNYTEIYIRRFGITPEDRVSHHITFSFDSHIRDFYPALAGGASLHFMPDRICKDPGEIYEFLLRNKITVSAYATAMGRLLLTGYDLKQRVVSVGGEALQDVRGGDVRVINICGATEVTDIVLDYELEKGRYYKSVPLGRPLENCYAFILDEAGNLLPQGVEGEICYVGHNVGLGYWHKDELTREVFTDCPVLPGQVMYHTRDLGRYNEDGNVEYLGRLDFQIKLRGFRIELGEVESVALQFDGIKQAVADVRNDQLVLYFVADKDIQERDIQKFLAQSLTDYMIPTAYVQLDAIPMTPSGKFDRKKLPAPEKSVEKIIAPSNEIERELLEMIISTLKYKDFGVTNNLIALGLNSLSIMRLSGTIKSKWGVNVRVSDIMKEPTIRKIAEMIREHSRQNRVHVFDKREVYPATENQMGIFIDCEKRPNTTQYNVPSALKVEADPFKLKEAILTALSAHKYLNVRFVLEDGELHQVRRDELPFSVEIEELNEAPSEKFFQSLIKPFDILNDVLYRCKIFVHGSDTWLFIDIHHIVYDGLSSVILMKDIERAYSGEEIESENVTAFDFALSEKELEGTEEYREAEEYFDRLVEGAASLTLSPSPEPDGIISGNVEVRIPAGVVDAMSERFEVTVNSVLQAAFAETLFRLTRENKLLYLTVSSGRGDENELGRTVGMFVKTLPFVHDSSFGEKGKTVRDYVKAVHRQLMENISREFYPYTKLVDRHGIRTEIMFTYQGGLYAGDGGTEIHLELNENKLPLNVIAYPSGGEYVIRFDYDGRLYAQSDIARIAHAFGNVVVNMATAESLNDVKLLTNEEEAEIMSLSAGEKMPFDESMTYIDLFNENLTRYSERLAVSDEFGSITYAELARASDVVAAYLVEHGVRPNDFVALKIDRVKEFVIAVLGIHKAGAAYVPIDLNYPEERQNYMLENSAAKIVLTGELISNLATVISQACNTFKSLARPEGYAYMIYTSGSTGLPKGAVLHHKGLLNYTLATIKYYKLTCDDRIGFHFSFSFDGHIEDIYPVLLSGASIHIMPERIRRDPEQIVEFLKSHSITGGGYTTSVARLLVQNYDLPQRYITAGGEALTEVTAPAGLQVINRYGPTECTNVVTLYLLENGRSYDKVPIGRVMPNGYALILDPCGNLLPNGAVGELCYKGPQVGYGYWRNEELTKKVFVDGTYHTGDLARYNNEGQIEYLGRIDFQVKVNGYRIELQEIESVVLKLSEVRQAVAIVRNSQVILYYTLNAEIPESKLREALEAHLASYMLPSFYVRLDSMPQTPSGKIDRKALPEINLGIKLACEAPSNSEEEAALKILRKLIPAVEFGVTDDLIELGMNSLMAMKLVAELSRNTNKSYRMARLLSRRTIRAFLEDDIKICRYHRDFDSAKPVLVVPSGNTTLVGTEHLYRSWDKLFNVLIIEPLAIHYEKILSGKSFDEVVNYYIETVKAEIPEGAKVFGFLGFSFGGEIAYHMACKWKDSKPVVIMGDTFLKRTLRADQVEFLTEKSFGTSVERFMAAEGLSMDEIIYMANLMRRLDMTEKNLRHYDGQVIFLNALKDSSEQEKLKVLNEVEPEAQIINLPEEDHGSIFLNVELEELYLQIFSSVIIR